MNVAGLLADLVLLAHAAVVVFVVLGQALVMAGGVAGWGWIRNRALRLAHLALMAFVAAQAWLGAVCPLTTLEQRLRRAAGQAGYETSFVEHWVSRLIFYQAPAWVFVLAYTVFLGLVVVSWWRWPPRPRPR